MYVCNKEHNYKKDMKEIVRSIRYSPYRSSKLSVNFENSDQEIDLSDESLAMMEEIPDLEFANSNDDNLNEIDYPIIRELLNMPQSEESNLNLDNIIDQLISGNMARRSVDLLIEDPINPNSPILDEFWEIVQPIEMVDISDYPSSLPALQTDSSDPLTTSISGEIPEQIYSPHSLINESSTDSESSSSSNDESITSQQGNNSSAPFSPHSPVENPPDRVENHYSPIAAPISPRVRAPISHPLGRRFIVLKCN